MGLKLRLANHLLCFVTPLVTGCVLATSPSLAATLASSGARLTIDNFSHNPQKVKTLTDTDTFTIALSDGSVTAEANANSIAKFDPSEPPTRFSNFSWSETSGEGNNYFGLAQSQAGVIAYDFLVRKDETFSFDFNGFLGLATSIDEPQSETASAAGELSFQLYDSNSGSLLDNFTLAGNLTTPGRGDFLDIENSTNITFNPSETSFERSFGGRQEAANASINGQFSRIFDSLTALTLVEVKTNQASVQVPEPGNIIEEILWFCLIGVGFAVRSKVFKAKSKITH